MPKYGRGLNREIVGAVNQGIIVEPFSVSDIRHFAKDAGGMSQKLISLSVWQMHPAKITVSAIRNIFSPWVMADTN